MIGQARFLINYIFVMQRNTLAIDSKNHFFYLTIDMKMRD